MEALPFFGLAGTGCAAGDGADCGVGAASATTGGGAGAVVTGAGAGVVTTRCGRGVDVEDGDGKGTTEGSAALADCSDCRRRSTSWGGQRNK